MSDPHALVQDFGRALQYSLSNKENEDTNNISVMVFNSIHQNDINYLSRLFDKVLLSNLVLKQEFEDLSKANQFNQMPIQIATSIRGLVDSIVDLNTMTVKPGLIDLIGEENFKKILILSKNDHARIIHSLVKAVALMYTQGLVEWVGKQGPLSPENEQLLIRMNGLATKVTVQSLLSPEAPTPQSINLDALQRELDLRTAWLNEEIANFPDHTLYGGLRTNLEAYWEKIDEVKQKLEYNMPLDPVAIDNLFMEIAITSLIVMVKNLDESLLKNKSNYANVYDMRVALENKRHQLNVLLGQQVAKSSELAGSQPVDKESLLTSLMSLRDDLEHIANDKSLLNSSSLDFTHRVKGYFSSYANPSNDTPHRDISAKLTEMKETLRVLRRRDTEPNDREESSYPQKRD